ncbi:flavodoxin, partial [Bacteroides heparinolyticus]|uniref:flavodoxin n=1 Tax=Prevotella heparinolytica TaxID=28113 RepID=UPI00359FAFA3
LFALLNTPELISTMTLVRIFFIDCYHYIYHFFSSFATSGSSGIENSVVQLKKDYPEIQWRDGRLLNGATEQTIREWVEKELKK